MFGYYQAVKFLLGIKGEGGHEATFDEHTLKIKNKNRRVLTFEADGRARGTIIILHGMSPMGPDDPRMLTLCNSVRKSGYRVLCPDISEIRALKIAVEQIDIVRDFILAINREMVEPGERTAVMAPSFSAGLGLAAIADEGLAPQISSMCSLGTFANIDNVVEFFFTSDSADHYGRLIVFKNFIGHVVGKNPQLERAFTIAIEDNWHDRKEPHLQRYMKKMSPESKRIYKKLMTDNNYRLKALKKILEKTRKRFKRYNITDYTRQIETPVLLVHGADDHVIPPSESRQLHHELRNRGKSSRLLVTPFLSHGDTSLSLKQFLEIWRLVSSFAFFFRNV